MFGSSLPPVGTQDENKQNKNTAQYVMDTTMRKQTRLMPMFIDIECEKLLHNWDLTFLSHTWDGT
jgi:hypothetical protein